MIITEETLKKFGFMPTESVSPGLANIVVEFDGVHGWIAGAFDQYGRLWVKEFPIERKWMLFIHVTCIHQKEKITPLESPVDASSLPTHSHNTL